MLRGPNTWSYIIPGLSVRVFLVEMNIWISRLSKSDCIHNMDVPHAINWKLNRTKKLSKREFFLSELMSWETNLFQPSDSIETFHPDSFFKILIFNWRIITILWCFYHTLIWISHTYTYAPSLLNIPPISFPVPTLLSDSLWNDIYTISFPGYQLFIPRLLLLLLLRRFSRVQLCATP